MEPEDIKEEIEELKEKHLERRRATPRYLQKAKEVKLVGELKINEKVEAIEYILHCPKCQKDSSHFAWTHKHNTAICPDCKAESPKERIKIVQEIKTSLTRLK